MQQDGGKRRHRRGRVLIKALVAGALVVVCGLGLLALAMPSSESSGAIAPIDLARATVMTFDITTTCTGDLQARKQIELRSELDTDTTIVELVAEGSKVEQGELVIKLNGDQIKSQVYE
jgi:multidrug efflux pump subunit AcrA (membrane-fusion protein)